MHRDHYDFDYSDEVAGGGTLNVDPTGTVGRRDPGPAMQQPLVASITSTCLQIAGREASILEGSFGSLFCKQDHNF